MGYLSYQILSTIVYYDVLDYPLTSFEIWKYLLAGNNDQKSQSSKEAITVREVVRGLESEEVKKYVREYWGFYFLKGRDGLAAQRIQRNKISEVKFRKIQPVVWWLRFVPFVRMVAVTGRVAMKNATRQSDLDLLIALEEKHIFMGRLLVTGLVHLLGKRRHGNKIKDRICLNYYITTSSLEIDLKDLFSSSEYFFIMPVFGFSVFKEFGKENGWIKKFRDNYYFSSIPNLKMLDDSVFSRRIRTVGEKIFGLPRLEKWVKYHQVKKIKLNPKTLLKESMIIADDHSLVFLPEPQGPAVYERYKKKREEMEKNA